MMKLLRLIPLIVLASLGVGQTQYPPAGQSYPSATQANAAQATPPVADVTALLSRIDQETRGLNMDVSRVRTDKWKADSSAKRQASQNVASIQRNITAALPELMMPVRNAPQSLAANFKLYRNLNALYEVLSGLAETTGAFGKREEYDVLAQHVSNLDEIRRSYADTVQQMSANADTRIATFQQALSQAQAQAPQPTKKVVVDDDEPAPAPKKKKTAKKPAANNSSATSSSSAPK